MRQKDETNYWSSANKHKPIAYSIANCISYKPKSYMHQTFHFSVVPGL